MKIQLATLPVLYIYQGSVLFYAHFVFGEDLRAIGLFKIQITFVFVPLKYNFDVLSKKPNTNKTFPDDFLRKLALTYLRIKDLDKIDFCLYGRLFSKPQCLILVGYKLLENCNNSMSGLYW